MEGRLPPGDGDDLFEWTDTPSRTPSEPGTGERETPGTGERERVETGEHEAGTGEHERGSTAERAALRWQRKRAERRQATSEGRAVRPDTRERRAVRGDTGERRPVRGDTGEFERSGRKPPPGRRERHRDLPARIRQRQAIGIGAVALIVLILLIVLISGGSGNKSEPVPLKKLVGQTIVAKVGAKGPDPTLLKSVRKGWVGSVIVFPRSAQTLSADVERLQSAASDGGNPPLLVMIDQEGGDVKRLPDGPPDESPQQLGQAGDADAAKSQGEKTATYLSGLGVNTDLAPVLDVPQPTTDKDIASRTFSSNPSVVSSMGVAFAQGLQAENVIATAKHFPGLGRATASTDQRPVTIAATTEDLRTDVIPFKDAIEAGVGMVMVSTASYPTLTPNSKEPAAFSPAIVQQLLRSGLGFKGVIITDDLQAPSVTEDPQTAATDALQAGNDLLLFAQGGDASTKAFGAVISGIKKGEISRSLVQGAYDHVTSLKKTVGSQ